MKKKIINWERFNIIVLEFLDILLADFIKIKIFRWVVCSVENYKINIHAALAYMHTFIHTVDQVSCMYAWNNRSWFQCKLF